MSDREYCTACGNELAEAQIGLCDSCQEDRDDNQMRILPPDPERMNDDRAEWADHAIRAFAIHTGMVEEPDDDIVPDLLADLMHWCDRNHLSFDELLRRARNHYAEETNDVGTAGAQYTAK